MSLRARHTAMVVIAAILGIVVAVALAILTSNLTTQHVGLAGEPLRPASGLVNRPLPRTTPAPTTTTAPAPTTTAPAPTDEGEVERGDD